MSSLMDRQRSKMIASVNRITGRANCTEVVFLQRRPRWVLIAFVVVFVAASLLVPDSLGVVAKGAIAGGLGGLIFALSVSSYMLGRCGDSVFLVLGSRWQPTKAVELVHEWPNGVHAEVVGGFINKKVSVAGENYLMSKLFQERLQHISN